MKSVGAIIAATLMAPSQPAHADLIYRTGKIDSLYFSYAANYALRVLMSAQSPDPLAGCTGNFAYINKSDDNYEAKVAGILTAYSADKTVNLIIDRDASSFCMISEYSVG
jgi:hypothetical protein